MRRCKNCRSGMLRDLRSGYRGGARRKAQREDRAAFATAIDGHTATMRNGDLLHDGQPKTAPANAIGSTTAVERLEQMRQIARGDSGAAVFDGDGHDAI